MPLLPPHCTDEELKFPQPGSSGFTEPHRVRLTILTLNTGPRLRKGHPFSTGTQTGVSLNPDLAPKTQPHYCLNLYICQVGQIHCDRIGMRMILWLRKTDGWILPQLASGMSLKSPCVKGLVSSLALLGGQGLEEDCLLIREVYP